MNIIWNFIRSERDGYFLLNIKTIQDLPPMFLGSDSLNYLICGSFYLEFLGGGGGGHLSKSPFEQK